MQIEFLLNRETLISEIDKGRNFDYLFFWGHKSQGSIDKSCLSQFYPCRFKVEGVEYNCAEQYMMS